MTKFTTRKSATHEDRSIKLTDTELAVLSGAGKRQDGAAAMPEGKNEKAVQKLTATLIEKGLVREVRLSQVCRYCGATRRAVRLR
jgi:hypothetical protein